MIITRFALTPFTQQTNNTMSMYSDVSTADLLESATVQIGPAPPKMLLGWPKRLGLLADFVRTHFPSAPIDTSNPSRFLATLKTQLSAIGAPWDHKDGLVATPMVTYGLDHFLSPGEVERNDNLAIKAPELVALSQVLRISIEVAPDDGWFGRIYHRPRDRGTLRGALTLTTRPRSREWVIAWKPNPAPAPAPVDYAMELADDDVC